MYVLRVFIDGWKSSMIAMQLVNGNIVFIQGLGSIAN